MLINKVGLYVDRKSGAKLLKILELQVISMLKSLLETYKRFGFNDI